MLDAAAQAAAFMLLAAEEYVLEYLSEAEEPESTAIAIAHLLATAASEASKQVPERLPLTVLISLAQMTGPLVRRLPQDMAQVGAGQRVGALSALFLLPMTSTAEHGSVCFSAMPQGPSTLWRPKCGHGL